MLMQISAQMVKWMKETSGKIGGSGNVSAPAGQRRLDAFSCVRATVTPSSGRQPQVLAAYGGLIQTAVAFQAKFHWNAAR